MYVCAYFQSNMLTLIDNYQHNVFIKDLLLIRGQFPKIFDV